MKPLPLLAVTVGDPAGIGPEVTLAALAVPEVRGELRGLVLGPAALRPSWIEEFAPTRDPRTVESLAWLPTYSPRELELGRAQAEGGRAALDALKRGVDLALAQRVDALVTAPVSKEALHMAGEKVEGQTELLGRWAGVTEHQMIAIAGPLRVMLLTRHIPLRQALDAITPERVFVHLKLLHATLVELGFERPRLALAGVNPHAGEGGILGTEELELFPEPLARARALGIDVTGPLSPDTVFLAAFRGRFDGVLALYHDQAFIAAKIAAPDTGLTLIAGLPFLRVSPAHGTAFEIAGKGRASAENMKIALLQTARWAARRPTPAPAR
ncbi:MAG TPA: 4-hydroxythreonine-4-phosphate dehydrogenase PdxA [Planctomycetota bacterium]|nr:4-hydroxythreonine-4-phosphate dehydrogenase PdxA [Planctomycetota bacterium]